MKLLRLKLHNKFRGLNAGFELFFRQDNYTEQDINEPICFVGLNGSGKSNTLEVISEIFYYLELQTISTPKEFEQLNERYDQLGFEVEYLISDNKWKYAFSRSTDRLPIGEDEKVSITCIKKKRKPLEIFATSYTKDLLTHQLPIYLWKEILPSRVIGYSSGQNELISNAFIKLDFYYFDQFQKRKSEKNILGSLDVNRMFFMDYESNELVVLSNFLFHEKILFSAKGQTNVSEKLRIDNLHSFSIRIQTRDIKGRNIDIPSELNLGIEKLKQCATTWIDNEAEFSLTGNIKYRIVDMDFYTDAGVRKAFRNVFKNAFELFRLLYLFRLLNINCFSALTRDKIKHAPQGTNLSELIPKPAIENLLFKIDGIKFKKSNVSEPVTYKQLSDGEHQLLHIMGTLQLMQESDSLFILDEPETHFNPEWRAKMIFMIMHNNRVNELMQDYFITSHSPFIISDCKPNNVYIFSKNDEGIKVETAAKKRLNTFGTSVNILTDEVFNKNESIADYSLAKLNEIKNRKFTTLNSIKQAKEDARILGESVEKTLLFRKLIMLEDIIKKKIAKK